MQPIICSQTVHIVDLGDKVDARQRYQVRVTVAPPVGDPVETFVSRWTDALEATVIWRQHCSKTLDRVSDQEWKRLIKFKT